MLEQAFLRTNIGLRTCNWLTPIVTFPSIIPNFQFSQVIHRATIRFAVNGQDVDSLEVEFSSIHLEATLDETLDTASGAHPVVNFALLEMILLELLTPFGRSQNFEGTIDRRYQRRTSLLMISSYTLHGSGGMTSLLLVSLLLSITRTYLVADSAIAFGDLLSGKHFFRAHEVNLCLVCEVSAVA